ncbi:ATP-dependent DNA ligase [Aeromicrobium sp. 50.2.37]|uniref:ATP-dependent DNA ligase n=1 Tax=Aeromicrobium sp. 50.2.37 TaxID=2969305 RepID=UPI00214FDAA5|nr:ATP-dependent DNA ligase [Aeromicrobium sp. 50.2.37]MCR4514037.1 ATP-dependent DNA ligase [Aeromicrobium sp. 50.2.37]
MAGRGSSQTVQVDGRRLRVTNLDKVLYPASGTTKAEVISYYVAVADRLLPWAIGRPATRKRWPDGVGVADRPGGGSGPRAEKSTEVFFEKNLPDSAPDWVRRVVVRHKSHVNVYPIVDSPATLAWLGQVAALELHVPQWRVDADGTPRHPDRLVLDLDPGPGAGLAECVEVALAARELLDDVGLTAWPVTSGSKGLHLYARLTGEHGPDYVNAFAKQVAAALEDALPDLVVSSMKKSLREGKVLVDWSQNNQAKTTIAPYSLRGRAAPDGEGPFVAAPRHWDELGPDLRHLTMAEVLERSEDPLSGLGAEGSDTDTAVGGTAAPDRLTVYRSMRDASRTPEPVPADAPADGAAAQDRAGPVFVVQEHHATRLHYDVRLEREGVLVSWAVPKGPPEDPGKNHLAVPTEDHPMDYATFEGTIPKGEYGAGEVSIWDHGTYALEKWKDGEVIATLHGSDGGGLGGSVRFALIRTGENWLMHRMDPPREPAEDAPKRDETSDDDVTSTHPEHLDRLGTQHLDTVAPMLATRAGTFDAHADADAWAFEMKWDGVRVVATCDAGAVRLVGRSGRDVTATYPEITEALATLDLDDTVVDGEVVALDDAGAPSFGRIQQRIGLTKPREVTAARRSVPVRFVGFDLLRFGGSDVTGLPYEQRRELLLGLDLDDADGVDVPAAFDGDLEAAMEASRTLGLEGVVAKRRTSRYRPGARSAHWVKLKHEQHVEVVVVGWRPGKGGRGGGIGSLLVAVPDAEGTLVYAGRVGTGFAERTLADLSARLEEARRDEATVAAPRDVAREAVWVEPTIVGEVTSAGWTDSGHLRHPVWRGLRDDKTVADVQPVRLPAR